EGLAGRAVTFLYDSAIDPQKGSPMPPSRGLARVARGGRGGNGCTESEQHGRRGGGKDGVIKRRLETKRDRHRGAEQKEEQRAAKRDPTEPDTADQGDPQHQLGHGGGPGEKRNRERGHEGIHLRRVLHEVREISIAGRFAPEAEAVRDAREERGSERDAGVEYRPSLHRELACAHGTLSLRGASWSQMKEARKRTGSRSLAL